MEPREDPGERAKGFASNLNSEGYFCAFAAGLLWWLALISLVLLLARGGAGSDKGGMLFYVGLIVVAGAAVVSSAIGLVGAIYPAYRLFPVARSGGNARFFAAAAVFATLWGLVIAVVLTTGPRIFLVAGLAATFGLTQALGLWVVHVLLSGFAERGVRRAVGR
jgi:hypothetical protein